ncbi:MULTISPECIES: hypothetical protein [Maribacter]|uniref:Uncharacterized protein n=1 Tax=Maribacter dokdonensis TaxID=320912 RepID=A0A1H4LX36_9FLAO|nr:MULTISPECIES: hypothetical protein [Maribacter]HAF75681.1 hypothetical protein [Maribacter sp.]APA64588.1 hypothetical protein YQ22_09805 [Maribacter sp. 1_2014MBL_MicDiv]KSA15334.1 hypothetical protein I600_1947 [Maribacter dokdonensis DSW-8]CAG2534589.1 hypothetical protein MAR621_00834 [Maribacter dokdonensis]SEB75263.1 hypothetical protein SAMN05192540_1451 [Maribacter dokdonensis]|tara:strand:- start:1253 stop:1627 length:375 start_codon:yes stop_codon:yes gene_type:complete
MKKDKLRERVLVELEKLISLSCKNPTGSKKYEDLHVALLKKHYSATNVTIDYHRHRIQMEVIEDVSLYDPKTVNTYLPTFYTNLLFNNLCNFLISCVEKDNKSIGFYTQLLNSFKGSKNQLELA